MMVDNKAKALMVLCDASAGCRGGELYARLMVFGVDLERFEGIMRALVATRQRGELYLAVGRR